MLSTISSRANVFISSNHVKEIIAPLIKIKQNSELLPGDFTSNH